ncbi:Glycoside hydrolase superfamily,Glycosyl hydrolase, family 13, catalytic domain [Cinara cedri]|uniref:alpha-glucosidase n=1 Tax=Cinara cedri TaxID=506608 RepID=A0A5E4MMI0_9HEMI|nr:Glycoside hydrolase superfamily,Glycosyl hydrolase, family 13, catalytic domain [Cinara cedri]
MKTFTVCWLTLVYYTLAINGDVYFPSRKIDNEWWPNTIIYQAYPRSFKDSNNDGVGDLKGITQKLDNFVDLGIETLWVGPIFKSPMIDMGYDVENFTMIDPIFGTMEDFDELVSEMNKRNLKLIIDIIPNHSSDKCEWFQKSIKRDEKYDRYYVWHNAKNHDDVINNSSIKPIPPNNWLSRFESSAWTWNEERKQFYFHQFFPQQPDFNLRYHQVHTELLAIMKFWLNKGVSGFRLDAVRYMYESVSFLDEPIIPGKEGSKYDDLSHIYTLNQPEIIDVFPIWRKHLDDYFKSKNKTYSVYFFLIETICFKRLMATESYSSIRVLMQYYGNETSPGVQIPFNFQFLTMDRTNLVEQTDQSIKHWVENLPENMVPNWVMENHDNLRMSFKYGAETVPLFTALKLALPGVDVTYYGSEIGMDNTFVRKDQIRDNIKSGRIRDNERSPMQWDDSINAGFTEAKKPWLPVNPNYYQLNVEAQKKIPTSQYNFYKKMSHLRKTNTLKYGDLHTYIISKSIYIIKRSLSEHESYLVVMNYGSETESIVLSSTLNDINENWYVYLGSENSNYSEGCIIYHNSSNNPLRLRPQSVVVLSDKEVTIPIENSSCSTHTELKLIILLCFLLFPRFLS